MGSWVVVVLPGGGYGPLGAALRFPVLVLSAAGADSVVAVEYPPRRGGDEELLCPDLVSAVDSQIRSAVSGAQRITFVAKSLGTAALSRLDPRATAAAQVEAVWLTPLLMLAEVRAGIAARRSWRSLLVAGGSDPAHSPQRHEETRAALGCRSLVLVGANHALEVPGDPPASLDRLGLLTEAVTEFISGRHQPDQARSGA